MLTAYLLHADPHPTQMDSCSLALDPSMQPIDFWPDLKNRQFSTVLL